jgi:mRNA interferase RelE/StbE
VKNRTHGVKLHPRAQKYIKRMNEPFKRKILDGINGLRKNPPQGDIDTLEGETDSYRLRVGGYRIIFIENRIYFL